MHEDRQIGSIRIGERLARGGSGSIFVGFDEKLQRRVALKAVRRDRLSEEARGRLLREARVLSCLKHPNICAIYDFVEDEEAAYLVLELIEGENLRDALSSRLSWRRKLTIAEAVASAMTLAHAKGIVHRDLKLENVMLARDGSVRVLDFGLAWLPEDSAEIAISSSGATGAFDSGDSGTYSGSGTWPQTTGLTTEGSLIGTPRTMSPEQAQGEASGPPSDIYSFGIFLQELFTEQPAYTDARNRRRLLKRVSKADTLPMVGVDRELVRLIERLVERLPEHRPTAAEALAGLRRLVERPRRRARWAASVALLALAAGGAAKYIVDLEHEKNAALVARAEAEQASLESERVLDFLRDLLESASPVKSLGAELTAREILAAGAERLAEEQLEELPLVRARMLSTVGGVQLELGLFDEAEPLLVEALDLRRQVLGDENLEVAQSRAALAEVYRENRKADAAPLFEQSLATMERLLGESDSKIADVLNSLGVVYGMRGELEQAKPILERALAMRSEHLGREHPKVALTLNNLGIVAALSGEMEPAEKLFLEGLHIREKALDPKHPDLAANLEALAVLYANDGRPAEAEPMHRRVVAMWMDVYGKDHPKTALAMNNLGRVLADLGKFEEAQGFLNDALRTRLKSLGEEHPSVAISYASVASVEAEIGLEESARSRCQVAASIARELSPKHRARQIVAAECASVLRQSGQPERAARLEAELASSAD